MGQHSFNKNIISVECLLARNNCVHHILRDVCVIIIYILFFTVFYIIALFLRLHQGNEDDDNNDDVDENAQQTHIFSIKYNMDGCLFFYLFVFWSENSSRIKNIFAWNAERQTHNNNNNNKTDNKNITQHIL